MNVRSMTFLILLNSSYILEPKKTGKAKFSGGKMKCPTAPIRVAVKLPGKINEFLTQRVESVQHTDNSPIILEFKFWESRTI